MFITHDLLLARNICDRIIVMYKGAIVETGTAKEIMEDPKHPYTKLLLACVLKPRVDKEFQFVNCDSIREPAPDGCRFYEYCPYAKAECSKNYVKLMKKEGREVACLL